MEAKNLFTHSLKLSKNVCPWSVLSLSQSQYPQYLVLILAELGVAELCCISALFFLKGIYWNIYSFNHYILQFSPPYENYWFRYCIQLAICVNKKLGCVDVAGFGEASPEAKAAKNLHNFFTYVAVRIVTAQLQVFHFLLPSVHILCFYNS